MHPPPSDPSLPLVELPLRLLTSAQYENTIADLLGPGLDAGEIPADQRINDRGFTAAGTTIATVEPASVARFEELATSYASQVFADEARRSALLGCAPADPADPCIGAFIERFGRMTFRRPLSSEERATFDGLLADLLTDGSLSESLELLVTAFLQSPYFLYRVELGESAVGGARAITDFEMASRLSFALLNRGPSEALLDAAAAGELDTADGVQRHAAELLADPRAVPVVQSFFHEYFKLGALSGLHRDPEVFPDFDPALGPLFREEIDRLIEEAFREDLPIRGLLNQRRAFVNDDLARHYDIDAPGEDWAGVDLPEASPRRGLLSTGAFLVSHAAPEETSPMRRGWFIRLALLCDEIEEPPPDAQANFPEADRTKTMRERFAEHVTNPSCQGCHNLLDPLGLPMEDFDAVGAFRETDLGRPLDLSGELEGVTFWGTAELADTLAEHPSVGPCITANLIEYFGSLPKFHRQEELGEAILGGATSSDLRSLLVEITASDVFRYGTAQEGL